MKKTWSLLTILMVFGLVAGMLGTANAQVATWAVSNAFNLIRGDNTNIWIPGDYPPGDYPLVSTDYTEARINTWRYATTLVKLEPVIPGTNCSIRDDAGCTEVFNQGSAVLRLDLRSHGSNVQFRAITLTLLGGPDFDPNEDLLPINPDSAAMMFYGTTRTGQDPVTGTPITPYVEPVDTLTGVCFFAEAGMRNSRASEPWRKDRFDADDVRDYAEALVSDSVVQPGRLLDNTTVTYTDIMSRQWTEVTTADIRTITSNSLVGNVPPGWRWWRATFVLRQAIDISYNQPAFDGYGLEFKRIWITLRSAGCHECLDNTHYEGNYRPGTPHTIEGMSNVDRFYTCIISPNDLVAYDFSTSAERPYLIHATDKIRVLPNYNSIFTEDNERRWWQEDSLYRLNSAQARWATAEVISGQDADAPVIRDLYPYNTVCTNGPNTGVGYYDAENHLHLFEDSTSIYTADSMQVIKWTVTDMGACADSVRARICYTNFAGNAYPNRHNSLSGSDFCDEIVFYNRRNDPVNGDPWTNSDLRNSGYGNGWEWQINGGSWLTSTTSTECAVISPCDTDLVCERLDTISNCPLVVEPVMRHRGDLYPWEFADTFYIRVGADCIGDYLENFIDGASVRVTIDAWDRSNRGPGTGNGRGNHSQQIINFIVDLSGPNAELECPTNGNTPTVHTTVSNDDSTREYRRWWNNASHPREDIFEGEWRWWVFLSDSMPTITFRLYDDYGANTPGPQVESVHDVTNHGTGYWGRGVGGGGINIRQMDLVFRHVPCEGDPYEVDIFSDSSTGNANQLCGYPMRGVKWNEDADGMGGQLMVDLARQHDFDEDYAMRNGEIVYLIARRLYDDMDWGQAWPWDSTCQDPDMSPNVSYPIDETFSIRFDDDVYRNCEGDPNYGTRHRNMTVTGVGSVGDNHVVLDQQITIAGCDGYTQSMEDTMGIIRMDMQGPLFDAVTYYPPPGWITSDSFQAITIDIYDPQICTMMDLGNYTGIDVGDGSQLGPGAASGIFAPHLSTYNYENEHWLPYVNIKVRHCDGSYNNYYSNSHATADRRRPYATPADGRDWFLDDQTTIVDTLFHGGSFADRLGVKVIWDPRQTESLEDAKFRSGDKVCVTVHTWDNAVNWCSPAGANAVDQTRNQMENWNPLDPDFPIPPDPDWPYWFFYVDYMPPVMVSNTVEQWMACDDTLYFFLNDVNDSVSNGCPVQTNWIAGVGCVDVTLRNRQWPVPGDGWYNETDSGLIVFSPNALDPTRTDTSFTPWNRVGNPLNHFEDLIIIDSLCLGESRMVEHTDVEYHEWEAGHALDHFTIDLVPWGEDGAVIRVYNYTCLMFQDQDSWEFGVWAGDAPNVPWFPASRRTISGATWRWDHYYEVSPGNLIGIDEQYSHYRYNEHFNWIRSGARRYHVYENTRTCNGNNPIIRGTLNITRTDDTTPYRHLQADWENPNWTKVLGAFPGATTDSVCWAAGVQNPEALPFRTKLYKKTRLANIRWFNTSGFWNMIDLSDDASFDLTQYDVVGGDLMGQYTAVLDSMQLPTWYFNGHHYVEDMYTTHFVNNEMNYLVGEITTCNDSIILECEDTVYWPFDPTHTNYIYRTPTLYVHRLRGSTTDTLFYDHYDCYCETCNLRYYTDRVGCTDIGRLVAGPLGNQYQWRYLNGTYVNGDFGPNRPTDPYPLRTGDQLICTLYVNVKPARWFNVPLAEIPIDTLGHFLYKFIWKYTVDNMGPSPDPNFEFSLNTTSGYEEVNCEDRFDGNSTVRLRLNHLFDAQNPPTALPQGVGIDGNDVDGQNWGMADRPVVVWNSDEIVYQLNHATQPAWMDWNDYTVQLWSNEELPIIHCFDDTFFNIAEPRRIDDIPRDSLTFADTLYGAVTVQDKLGNESVFDWQRTFHYNGDWFRVLPGQFVVVMGETTRAGAHDTLWVRHDTTFAGTNKIILDNDLPHVKRFGLYYRDSIDSLVPLDTLPPCDRLPSVVVDANSRDTTVFFVLTFDDNMDMSMIDGSHDWVVRFRPLHWARWVPIFPVAAADMRFHPELLRAAGADENPAHATDLLDGWHTDFQWIGYARIPRYYMDGCPAILRISGFDDNAGNQMLTQDFQFNIGTFQTCRPDIVRPSTSPLSSVTPVPICDQQWRAVDTLHAHICDSDTVLINRLRPDQRVQVRWQIFECASGALGAELTPGGWGWGNLTDTIRQIHWTDVVPPRSGSNPGYNTVCIVFTVDYPNPFTDRADTLRNIVIDNAPPSLTITSPVDNQEIQMSQFDIPIRTTATDQPNNDLRELVCWAINEATRDTVGGTAFYNGTYSPTIHWNPLPGDAYHTPGLYEILCVVRDAVGQVNCDAVTHVHIINPVFLARGDNWSEALAGDYDNVRQMYPVPPPYATNVVNWPTWAFFCDGVHPLQDSAYWDVNAMQITTYNNWVGIYNPLLPSFTSPIDYPGDSLYILLHDANFDSVWIDVTDENGDSAISGSNLRIHRTLYRSAIRPGPFRQSNVWIPDESTEDFMTDYFVLPWTVDDQLDRFDGPVMIKATIWIRDRNGDAYSTVNKTFILLDTAKPVFHNRYSRIDTGEPLQHMNVDGYGEVWFTNADDILATIGWNQTVFQDDPLGVEDYVAMPAVARTYEYVGLTIDGQPEGLHLSDPNDHLASRAWIDYIFDTRDEPLTTWFTEVAHPGYSARSCFGTFGDTLYKYNFQVANDPMGAGMALVQMKGRDAAGNVLDYDTSWTNPTTCTGRFVFIDLVPPTIRCDASRIHLGPFSLTIDPGTIDDDNLNNVFWPYVYVNLYDHAGAQVAGPIWVNTDGSTDPWSVPVGDTLVGDYTLRVYDLAGNYVNCSATVAEILDCVTYNFCRGYNFVSIPLTMEGTTMTAPNLFGSFITNVRYFQDCGTYVDDVNQTLVPGRGYLVTANTETTVTLCGRAICDQPLTLCRGWNWIGSIFGTYDLTLAPSCIDATEMYRFDCATGGWVSTTTIPAGGAAMVLVTGTPCDLTMSCGAGSGRVVMSRDAELNWNIDLNIASAGEVHNLTLGAATEATSGYDSGIDHPALPKFEGTDAYVVNGPTSLDKLVRDIRGNAAAYTFNVQTVNTSDFTATWNVSKLPADLKATLYVDGKAFDMSQVDHLNLAGAKRFAIEVTKGVTPSAYALGEAEPNPFYTTTDISYSLPVDGPVTVKILNVLGSEVNVLVNGNLTAGIHSTTWDGTAADGSTVLPGVYLYKLEAGDFTATRSLILVK